METLKQKGDKLSHYQKKIMSKQGGLIWTKDVRVNVPLDGDFAFDDFFRIDHTVYKQSKLKGFTIWRRNENSYLSGLQFTYQSSKDPSAGKPIEGWLMSDRNEQKRAKTYNSKSFILDDDEYAIKLSVRTGMVLDHFSVETNKGRKLGFGEEDGKEKSVCAPKGYHFTNFGGHFSEGWDSISSFSTEIQEIPVLDIHHSSSESTESKLCQLLLLRPILRNIIPYLTTNEQAKIFRLNTQFAYSRFDEGVSALLLNRCLKSGAPKLLKYLKKMVKNAHFSGESFIVERANRLFSLSMNRNSNPHGENKFEGYSITRNGGNGIEQRKDGETSYFITSHGWGTLQWSKSFGELFVDNERQQIVDGLVAKEYAIVFAADFCDTGFGVQGEMVYKIFDEDRKLIKQDKQSMRPIPKEFTTYSFKYIHEESESIPHSVVFEVSGKDTCFWAGHYGAKIRNISFSLVPLSY